MIISTEIGSASKIIGEEKAVELIAKAGFDAWDFSMFPICQYNWSTGKIIDTDHPLSGKDYLAFARRLRYIGEENGIFCNQAHAPFPTNAAILPYIKKAIECTAEAGGKICIIHPNNDATAYENAEIYFELLPFAKECGVKIATENMWNWDNKNQCSSFAACSTTESFLEHLNAVNDESFVACLDIGHAEMKGSGSGAAKMIRGLGSQLKALHIHDNDLLHDNHQIPFSMDINFEEIVKALKEINYSGEFTLEAEGYLKAFSADNIFRGITDLADSAKRLVNMFENIK